MLFGVRTMFKKTVVTLIVLMMSLVAGCQFDIQGPSATAKIFRKDENHGMIYMSRGSGMAGGNTYASNGGSAHLLPKGDSGAVFSWGNAKK